MSYSNCNWTFTVDNFIKFKLMQMCTTLTKTLLFVKQATIKIHDDFNN